MKNRDALVLLKTNRYLVKDASVTGILVLRKGCWKYHFRKEIRFFDTANFTNSLCYHPPISETPYKCKASL